MSVMKMNNIILLLYRNKTIRFCLTFGLLLFLFSIILYQKPSVKYFGSPLTKTIAYQAAWILNAIGIKVAANGIAVSGENFQITIRGGCNAIYEISLFLSAIIAYPSPLKDKLWGGIAGSVIIYILNLSRVVALFLIGIYSRNYFDMVHDHVSQSLFIFVVAVLWLLWAAKSNRSISSK